MGEGAHLGERARVDGYLLLTTHYLLLATYLGELARVDGACGHEEARDRLALLVHPLVVRHLGRIRVRVRVRVREG